MKSRLTDFWCRQAALPCRRAVLIAACLAGLASGGCMTDPFNPGNIYSQRLRATIHDPYSDQDLGPEVVGGRPRDYQQQLPEPVRNRLYVDSYVGP